MIVKVKAAPNRVAKTAPKGGKVIPQYWVKVRATDWIKSRINAGDILLFEKKVKQIKAEKPAENLNEKDN